MYKKVKTRYSYGQKHWHFSGVASDSPDLNPVHNLSRSDLETAVGGRAASNVEELEQSNLLLKSRKATQQAHWQLQEAFVGSYMLAKGCATKYYLWGANQSLEKGGSAMLKIR